MLPAIIILALPLLALLLTVVFWRYRSALEAVALSAATLELVVWFLLLPSVIHGGVVQISSYLELDSLGALILGLVTLVNFFVTWYSVGYLREEKTKGIIKEDCERCFLEYYSLLHVFTFAMFVAVLAQNPMVMWVSIEFTTLSTALLVSFYRKASAAEAAWKYFIINSVGLLLGLLGTILFSGMGEGGPASVFADLVARVSTADPVLVKLAFVLVLVGYGTKVGFVPMHTWRPDAYSKAPTPLAALFSGALLNVAFLAILRFKILTDRALETPTTDNLLLGFGLLSLVVAAFVIFSQENYKRLLAWSSIEHAGLAAIGFGFGGQVGVFAALLHLLYHSLAKSVLFLAAGNIFLHYGSTKLKNIQGMIRSIPLTSIIFFVGFLALSGVPPFGIFRSELYIVLAGLEKNLLLSLLVVVVLGFTFIGFFRMVSQMVFGESAVPHKAGETGWFTTLPPLLLLLVFIVLSFYLPDSISTLLYNSVNMLSQ